MSVGATGSLRLPWTGMRNVRAHAYKFSSFIFVVDEIIFIFWTPPPIPRPSFIIVCIILLHPASSLFLFIFYCFVFFTSRTVMYLVNVATKTETINSDLG